MANIVYTFGDGYHLDVDKQKLTRGDEVIKLTARPFGILQYLIENRDRWVNYKDIARDIFGNQAIDKGSTFRSQLSKMKKKIGDMNDDLIITRRNEGWRFVGDVRLLEGDVSIGHRPKKLSALAQSPAEQEIIALPPGIATPNPAMEEVLTIAGKSKSLTAPLAIDGCAELVPSYEYRGWRRDDIKFTTENASRNLPTDLAKFLAENPLSPEEENNPKLGLTELLPNSSEHNKIVMQAAPTSYFRTYLVGKYLRQPMIMQDLERIEIPLQRYCKGLFDYHLDYALPSILCSQITVVIDSGKNLLLAQRSRHRRNNYQPGKWCCSIEEQMSGPPLLPETTQNQDRLIDYHPFDMVMRGIQEELLGPGYPISADQVRLLSFIVEGINLNVSAVAIAHFDMNLEDVAFRCRNFARDSKSEIQNLDEVSFTMEALCPILFQRDLVLPNRTLEPGDWHDLTRMRVLAALYSKYGIVETNRRLTELSKNL